MSLNLEKKNLWGKPTHIKKTQKKNMEASLTRLRFKPTEPLSRREPVCAKSPTVQMTLQMHLKKKS